VALLTDIDYPLHDKTIVVTRCGRICLARKKSTSVTSLQDKPSASKKCTTTSGWSALWVMGYFDLETRVLEPLENPFGPKVLGMS
jgi:putative transposase